VWVRHKATLDKKRSKNKRVGSGKYGLTVVEESLLNRKEQENEPLSKGKFQGSSYVKKVSLDNPRSMTTNRVLRGGGKRKKQSTADVHLVNSVTPMGRVNVGRG